MSKDRDKWIKKGRYFHSEDLRVIKEIIPSDSNVLEIGCGTGANIWYLAREGFAAYGLDGSKVALTKAEERLNSENLKFKLIHSDAIKIPFSNSSFLILSANLKFLFFLATFLSFILISISFSEIFNFTFLKEFHFSSSSSNKPIKLHAWLNNCLSELSPLTALE